MCPDSSTVSFREKLISSVQSAVEEGRIGAPVFVRWTARVTPDQHADYAMIEAIEALIEWFGLKPEHVHQAGGSARHSVVHARWPDGRTALATAGPCLPGGRPGIDVMVLGSSGAIYHEGQAVRRQDLSA